MAFGIDGFNDIVIGVIGQDNGMVFLVFNNRVAVIGVIGKLFTVAPGISLFNQVAVGVVEVKG